MSINRKWQAKWLWAADARAVNTHLLFRADFTLDVPAPGAKLYIATESFARVFLNGKEVTQTSSLSYPTQHYYEECSVGEFLVPGENQLAILAWYIGIPSGASCPKDPGLLFEIVDADGKLVIGGGDERIKCLVLDAWQGRDRRSFWLNLDLIETLDYRRLPRDFPMVKDLSEFQPAEVQGSAKVRYVDLQLRDFPKPCGKVLTGATELFRGPVADRSKEFDIAHVAVSMEQREMLGRQGEPQPLESNFTVPPQEPGQAYALLIDLGDYEKGLPLMTVKGSRNASVDISWFEHLTPPDKAETVSKVYTTDRYLLPARRVEIHPEEWKCGRYLQVTFRNVSKPLQVKKLRWHRQHYPLARKFRFNSSSARLNRIVEICVKAAAVCMQDNIMDCPWRERRQWIGDAQRIGLTNHYAFGDRRLVRAVLAQQVHMQDVNGRMYSCLPIFEEYPTQSMAWFRAVLEYQQYTGDKSLLAEVGDNAEMLHRWFLRDCNRTPDGLLILNTPPVMNFIDNTFGSIFGKTSPVRANAHRTALSAVNLCYLPFLDDVAAAMDQLGRPWAAEQARQRRAELAPLILKHFLQADTGLLRDCADPEVEVSYSELTHARAVIAKLPGAQPEEWWTRFCEYRKKNPKGNLIIAGPFGKHDIFEALGRLGRREEIVRQIIDHWGMMVDGGADTSWETFSPAGSHCHGWGGTAFVAIARHVFGIDPVKGGTKRVENLAGVEWLECEIKPNS